MHTRLIHVPHIHINPTHPLTHSHIIVPATHPRSYAKGSLSLTEVMDTVHHYRLDSPQILRHHHYYYHQVVFPRDSQVTRNLDFPSKSSFGRFGEDGFVVVMKSIRWWRVDHR